MKTFRYFIITCALFFTKVSYAQQEMLFSQYFFSQLAVNPAYAGNAEGLSLTSLNRKQWVGLKGSPTTMSFIGHTPLGSGSSECRTYGGGANKLRLVAANNKQVGLGVVVFNDRVGVNNTFLASFAYSYKIKFSSIKRLSFGLQATMLEFSQDFDKLDNPNPSDPVFQDNIQLSKFNVGSGLFWEDDRYYLGFSVPEIIENRLNVRNTPGETQLRQYFLTGGYVFFLSRSLKFKPAFMMRHTEGLPTQFDINANLLIHDKFWVGMSYRYTNSVNLIFEFVSSDRLRLGLAYDYPTSSIKKATVGSAEIMINYTFVKSKKRVINPRYF